MKEEEKGEEIVLGKLGVLGEEGMMAQLKAVAQEILSSGSSSDSSSDSDSDANSSSVSSESEPSVGKKRKRQDSESSSQGHKRVK